MRSQFYDLGNNLDRRRISPDIAHQGLGKKRSTYHMPLADKKKKNPPFPTKTSALSIAKA